MDRMTLLYLLLAAVAGGLGAIHVPINGSLGVRIGSPLVATFSFYAVALGVIGAVCLVRMEREAFAALRDVPRWYFLAGVISVVVVGASTFLIPKLGALNVFAITVTMQLVVRTVISHFGWFDSPMQPVTGERAAGAALLLAGAFLVVRSG
ncbi:MAG: DMT family transporter [Acidobacteriota bacterium]